MIKKLKSLHGLDMYVVFSIASMIIYTIVSQVIAIVTAVVLGVPVTMDVLTTAFFGFFGGEIVTCALIKIFKLREKKKEESTDE